MIELGTIFVSLSKHTLVKNVVKNSEFIVGSWRPYVFIIKHILQITDLKIMIQLLLDIIIIMNMIDILIEKLQDTL